MTRDKAEEIAYQLLVAHMPASWLQSKCNRLGDYKTSPKAVRARDAIASELVKAYEAGVTAERNRGAKKEA